MNRKESLRRISVSIRPESEELVSASLEHSFGTMPCFYTDYETKETTAFVYIKDSQLPGANLRSQTEAALSKLATLGFSAQSGRVSVRRIRREDWANSWKRHFQPIEIGESLLIKPTWSRRRAQTGQATIILDPGLSFGTGQHATTFFCLSQIARLGKKGHGQSFLDIGTGSGILALAAAKLNFKPVEAFDFDPECVRVAKANAASNKLGHRIKLFHGDVTKLPLRAGKKFDLVCANLISNLLVDQSRRIVNRVNPTGTLVLAGILAAEFSEVRRAFENLGMKLVAAKTEKEWRSGAFEFLKK